MAYPKSLPPQPTPPSAYSLREFARINSVTPFAVLREIREGRLLARKVNNKTIILESDAAAWRNALPTV
jgi:hypothetical protein